MSQKVYLGNQKDVLIGGRGWRSARTCRCQALPCVRLQPDTYIVIKPPPLQCKSGVRLLNHATPMRMHICSMCGASRAATYSKSICRGLTIRRKYVENDPCLLPRLACPVLAVVDAVVGSIAPRRAGPADDAAVLSLLLRSAAAVARKGVRIGCPRVP